MNDGLKKFVKELKDQDLRVIFELILREIDEIQGEIFRLEDLIPPEKV